MQVERSSRVSGLARGARGLGLRPKLYAEILDQRPDVDYFEAITENHLGRGTRGRAILERVRESYPVVLHGVSLNLLGHEPLDLAYLDAVAELAHAVDAPFVSDHLCWTGAHGVSHHDLLPTPFVDELVDFAAERARAVQAHLGRPFGLENLSSYVAFRESTMSEHDFYAAVVRRAGCWFMLDVNNIHVSSVNLGVDPRAYLDAIAWERVLQIHVAGHTIEPDGAVVDTHDHPVSDPVWALYADAVARGGAIPTMLEWDASIPPLAELVRALGRADEVVR